MHNIHATLVEFDGKGILFMGKSGCGKSDTAFRMIMGHGAKLVADDRVNLSIENNVLYGSCPKEILGKMEVRHLGIASFTPVEKVQISLCVELSLNPQEIERLPDPEYANFLGVSVTKIKLYPFDCSIIYKIIAKLSGIIN